MDTKKSALLVSTVGSFLTPFTVSSVSIALPSMAKTFSLDAVLLSWIPTSYLLAAAVFLVPFGRIADIYGRKKIFTFGIIVYTISSLLCGLSPSIYPLLLFRVLQGAGGAMIFGTAVALLISVYPPGERGKVLGINVASVYVGLSSGPFLGGFLTQQLGWRSIFFANVPLGVLVISLLTILKEEWMDSRGEKFDSTGSLIYGVALVLTMYGVSLLPERTSLLCIAGGIFGILIFLKWETMIGAPVLDVTLFRKNTVFALSNVAAFISYSATSAITFLLSLYLQYIRGYTPQQAGLILLSQPVVMVIFSPMAGRLSDRIEPRIVASAGMCLTGVALFTFTFLEEKTAISAIVAQLALLGMGFAFFSSPNVNAIMSSVEKRVYGIASAMVATMRSIGQMTSMGIAMLVIAVKVGEVEITAGYYGLFLVSVKVTLWIFVGLCFVGVFASLARGNVR